MPQPIALCVVTEACQIINLASTIICQMRTYHNRQRATATRFSMVIAAR